MFDLMGDKPKPCKLPRSAQAAEAARLTVERIAAVTKLPSAVDRYLGLNPAALKAIDALPASAGLAKQLKAYEDAQERLSKAFGGLSMADPLNDRSIDQVIPKSVFDDDRPSLRLPKLPPNPIFKTNAHLAQVAEKIDALLDVEAKQVGLIDLMFKYQVEGGKMQTRLAIGGLVVGALGVLVAVLAIVLS